MYAWHSADQNNRIVEHATSCQTSEIWQSCNCRLLWGDELLDFIVPNANGILAFQSGFNTRVSSKLEETLWQRLSVKAARTALLLWVCLVWRLAMGQCQDTVEDYPRLRRLVPRWFSSATASVSTNHLGSLARHLPMQSFCKNYWNATSSFGRLASTACSVKVRDAFGEDVWTITSQLRASGASSKEPLARCRAQGIWQICRGPNGQMAQWYPDARHHSDQLRILHCSNCSNGQAWITPRALARASLKSRAGMDFLKDPNRRMRPRNWVIASRLLFSISSR